MALCGRFNPCMMIGVSSTMMLGAGKESRRCFGVRLRFHLRLGPVDIGHDAAHEGAQLLRPVGAWDPSLAVVMAAALAVSGVGFAVVKQRAPLLAPQNQWPTRADIDRPLLVGSALFGIGWGLIRSKPYVTLKILHRLSDQKLATDDGELAHPRRQETE
jgi:uncharacterized membrane protein YedE/YeeE